ncbi:response regulator transcription factor [Streptomyces sp. NPDC001982]|uniref:response regulator transcription factor n=1 Tax=unclassified Streptomyces TaxID=2593676 RepID=UPI0033175E2A
MASVLIVNDQSLHRLGLRMVLTAEPDLTVVGEATTGAEAVRMTAALGPDVVLMAVRPFDRDAIEAIRHITRASRLLPHAEPTGSPLRPSRPLLVTSTSHEAYAYAALRAGAGGCLPHDSGPEEVTAAIRAVAAGEAVLPPSLTRALIETVRRQPSVAPLGQRTRLDVFTGRERDVLIAVAAGWSNAEIAERLSIAPTTVKSHVSRILTKLGARARVQAVTYAYESGLLRPAA